MLKPMIRSGLGSSVSPVVFQGISVGSDDDEHGERTVIVD